MPARFADIKFNLMRAIELFEDMNHLDMDVTAPPSAPNFYKEIEVAQRLNIYLGQLIDEGVFEDCELRDDPIDDEEEDDEDEDEEDSDDPPRSEGFEYENNGAGAESQSLDNEDRGSRESFTDRFKRYIRRIIPGSRRRSEAQNDQAHDHDHQHHHGHHHHDHHHHERSQSDSGGIRPINATISADTNEDGEDIYDPSSSSYDGSDSVHDGHPIHRHHRPSSASTINSSQASGSARDSVIDNPDESESELDDSPLSPRSRSTSRSSTLSNRRRSSTGSRRRSLAGTRRRSSASTRRRSSASSRRTSGSSRISSRASSRSGRARSRQRR